MRRWLLIPLGVVGVVLIAILALPFWFGAMAGAVGPHFGLSFRDYTRLGYSRFALQGVAFQRGGLRATVDRLELPMPLAWLWQRATGQGAVVRIGEWKAVLPAGQKETPPPNPDEPAGWMPLRERITQTIAQLDPWLQEASVGSGVVQTATFSASVAHVTWNHRSLMLDDLAFRGRLVDVTFVAQDEDELRLTVVLPAQNARVDLASRGAALTGRALWWDQPATLVAEFPATGWRPSEAQLSAANWDVAGDKLKLGELYTAVRGGAELRWNGQRFTLEANAQGAPRSSDKPPSPPLDVAIRAHGDLDALTLETLHAQMPGAAVDLTAPLTIARSGEIRDAPARFSAAIDLAQLPWFEAAGRISGMIAVAEPAAAGPPAATFQIEARDVSASGVALQSAVARGELQWPQLSIKEATLAGPNGEPLRASGSWNFKTRMTQDVRLAGELRRETLARWLPPNISFTAIRVDARAEGPLTALKHQGRMQISEVRAAALKPLQIALDWNGAGRRMDRLDATITAGESRLSATLAADRESLRLSTLEFAPRGESPLRLARPATIRWTPALQVEPIALHSETSEIQAQGAWGGTGHIAFALRHIPSSWLADFVPLPGPPWMIAAVAIDGSWDKGPLTFEAIADVTARLDGQRDVRVNAHLTGDKNGVQLRGLRALDNGAQVITASGQVPAVLSPGQTELLRIKPEGPIALSVATVDNPPFWDEIGKLAGVVLEGPQLRANLSGTWRQPKGELDGRVARVSFRKRKQELPPLRDLELAVTGDATGITLDRLALRVEDQTLQAWGRLPFPKEGWSELKKDPLRYVSRGANFELQLPRAEIAAFQALLPELVVPQGTIEANLALRQGALTGALDLRGAATRPMGALAALHDIGASVRLAGDVVRVESISAELAGAPVRASGTITLPPLTSFAAFKAGKALPKLDVKVHGENLPLVRKTGTLVRADVDVAVTSPANAPPLVQGEVRLRDSLFLQDVRGLVPRGARTKRERPPYFAVEVEPFSGWRLDVRVHGQEFMRVRTTLFNGTASADFRLGGTLGEPTLLGEATIDRGKVRFPFASFDVQEGRVALTPAQPYDPEIALTATTRRFEYDLRMEVTGEAAAPAVTFESTPPLENAQVLLLVTAGVVPNNAITVTQQQRATKLGSYLGQSLLAGFGDGDDTSRLTITSGEDISERGRETYKIEYALQKRWSLTAEYDEYDTHTLGVKWQAYSRGGPRLAGSSESFDPGDAANTGGTTVPRGSAGGNTGDGKPAEPGAPTGGGGKTDSATAKAHKKFKPARLDVSGLGWFANFEMEASLKRMLGSEYGAVLEPAAVEDAVFLLFAAVREDGYLRPTARLEIVNADGSRRELSVDPDLSTPIPRDIRARLVRFDVDRGVHYHLRDLSFSGLHAFDEEAARGYFIGRPGLAKRENRQSYTPDRLKRGISSLESALRDRGYAEAVVKAGEPRTDPRTGDVAVAIAITEGPQWQIDTVDLAGQVEGIGSPPELPAEVGKPWTDTAEQDIALALRKEYLAKGYADARVQVTHKAHAAGANLKLVDLVARVIPGAPVAIGQVRFQGNTSTRDDVLAERVEFGAGDPLNPLALQHARQRLARLGVFRNVDVHVEPPDGPVRDVVFDFVPGKRMELNLLGGYNTYEQLRGGVEFRRYNLWGRAHQTRGLLVQSMKSTRGEYSYTIPELFGEDIHGTGRVFGLQREEVAFERQEYGLALQIDAPVRFLGANLTAGYNFQVLRNRENELESRSLDLGQVPVASIEAGLTRDRRDNPLVPRDGYSWFGRTETATHFLGGRAEYQRFELGGTYHLPHGTGRWWHFAVAHGVVMTLGHTDEQLPVNRRFFPGGDGSIRGYQVGEAAPRGADGRFVGAKSYVSASVEYEQALADKWSAVIFVDALGSARRLAQYPFDSVLTSAGLGIRFETLIGPVRAEYGFNLNRRPGDPRGTFLLSIGFPF